ncbi:AT-rich interactive domain-containing 5 [Olea europaea subsp. europaea]|uniref:AT-rich interactive domain-containing 5 n=1 Tax=Olea europaea subsp. europaea TaxID=158383 RepID=A0A8S0RSX4_OLEEU|nr:AT-rich interactive domain-containing 5 [Olea europaea subsp. europaea]
MDKSDVEIEDTEEHPQDSTNKVPESENKLCSAKFEFGGEELPLAAAAGFTNASKSGRDGQTSYRIYTDDESLAQSKMKEQINSKSNSQESVNSKGEVRDHINRESKTEDQIKIKSNVEDETNAINLVEEPTDSTYQMDEQSISGGGVQTEKPIALGIQGRHPVENVMEKKPTENVSEEKNPNEIGREDTNPVKKIYQEEKPMENADIRQSLIGSGQLPTEVSKNEAFQTRSCEPDEVPQYKDEEMVDVINNTEDKTVKNEMKEGGTEVVPVTASTDENARSGETVSDREVDNASLPNHHEAATPNSVFRYSTLTAGDSGGIAFKTVFSHAKIAEGDDGTPEDQAAFLKELEFFHRENRTDFKPPKFYGHPLNCLKLWRAVIRLGGYDRVTGSKLWRQVGESFHPPKTCTTVSWTFRVFYEKALLEYERHKRQSGELELSVPTLPEASVIDNEGIGYDGSSSGPGNGRRDAAARAMQGWHVRLYDSGEVGEPIVKDNYLNNMAKREKNLKSIGSLKQKRPHEVEHPVKAARMEAFKQVVTSVVDVGAPADWVKINVRQTKDCFEVYALVPGLSREEVRVQSDPAGRLVITGEPEQPENPWGTTAFKKVVSLPARINPHMTSAVVSMHGRLFIRVPFEQSRA